MNPKAPADSNGVVPRDGSPLDGAAAAQWGRRFGHDFSRVRIHSDVYAAESASAVHARAYTVGEHVIFGSGAYAPDTPDGRRLIAHELTHVVQQRGAPAVAQSAPLSISRPGDRAESEADCVADTLADASSAAPPIRERPSASLARAALDVPAVTKDVEAGSYQIAPNTRPMSIAYLKTLWKPHPSGDLTMAADYPVGFKLPADMTKPVASRPKADAKPPLSNIPVVGHFFPAIWAGSADRALVIGGFHGDERPGWEVADQLVNELSQSGGNIGLAFHTIVIPRLNAAAITDELAGVRMWRNRCNRQLVDLNRNFPTGKVPQDTDCGNTVGAPIQPEPQAVMDVINTFKPNRILSTHAISSPDEAGVFADPNQDPKAIEIAKGMSSTLVNALDRPFNRLGPGSFNPVYPKDKPGVVGAGTSLGSWGPTAAAATKTPVITMEAPGFGSLATGPGSSPRTLEGFMRPVRAFLGDPASLATQADFDILADIDAFNAADRLAFLTGRLPKKDDIFRRIGERVRMAIADLNAMGPPTKLEAKSSLRLFSEPVSTPGGTPQAEIDFKKFFGLMAWDTLPTSFFINSARTKGVDRKKWLAEPSKNRLELIVKFSALPGASRHHWNTEVDFNSVNVADWQPGNSLSLLGQWLSMNAAKAGLVQAYTAGRTAGYAEEPWHFSYAPISIGLRQRYNQEVNLSKDVIDAVLADFKQRASNAGETLPSDFEPALRAINVSDLVNAINPKL